MFGFDVPPAPPPQAPVLLAQANAASASPAPDYILKDCQETESTGDPRSAMRAVDPAGMLQVYFENYQGRGDINLAAIKTTLIEGAKNGRIFAETDNEGLTSYHYDAIPNYEGRDRVVFSAEFEGKRYKIIIDLRVFKQVNEYAPVCPESRLIKVKKPRTSRVP